MLSECQHGVKCYTQDYWVRVDWDRGVVECDVRLGGYFLVEWCDECKRDLVKSGRVFCRNAVKCEPVPIRVLNPRTCGVQGHSLGGGCRAAKPTARKKIVKFFSNNNKKKFS